VFKAENWFPSSIPTDFCCCWLLLHDADDFTPDFTTSKPWWLLRETLINAGSDMSDGNIVPSICKKDHGGFVVRWWHSCLTTMMTSGVTGGLSQGVKNV